MSRKERDEGYEREQDGGRVEKGKGREVAGIEREEDKGKAR